MEQTNKKESSQNARAEAKESALQVLKNYGIILLFLVAFLLFLMCLIVATRVIRVLGM